ncbi:MAG: GNAT family acetyltransferase [Chloroflexi bacterium]|nr:GNAT family acetyltransferase [Chloroflexota bacterium]
MHIRAYQPTDEEAVIALWEICGLTRPWNNPKRDIERKLRVDPDLFLVGEVEGRLVAAAMAGYEGHRGWVNYLAVHPDFQRQGLGRRMMEEIEAKLIARGCPKINVQIRSDNEGVIAFYRQLGFRVDATVSMGKRLIED